jgi:hypothetical protein
MESAVIESNQERVAVLMMIVNSTTVREEHVKVQLCISYRRGVILTLAHKDNTLLHQVHQILLLMDTMCFGRMKVQTVIRMTPLSISSTMTAKYMEVEETLSAVKMK